MSKYDYLIVGSGLFGAVFASMAVRKGKKCLVIEKRDHIAGNVYSKKIENIEVHMYGPHIFHTDNREVWDYVNQFADFNHFRCEPIANYKGQLYNLPFNMNTFHQMWGCNTPKEAEAIINEQRKEIKHEPQNLEEQAISLVGRDIYEKLIKGYTEKQWGRDCKSLPSFIIKRLPVRMRFDNNYFNHPFQGVPIGGYTKMVEKMLEGTEVVLGEDYLKRKDYWESHAETVIYTGAIDAYYEYCYGPLAYRSLKFEHEVLDIDNYQGVSNMNFTDSDVPYTRIVEHKFFEFGTQNKTVISKEYSAEFTEGMEPYYPVNDEINNKLANKYKDLSKKQKKVVFGGRLAEYTYYDMDKVVFRAMTIARDILGN